MLNTSVLPTQYVSESEWKQNDNEYYRKCAESILANHIANTYSYDSSNFAANYYARVMDNITLYLGEQDGANWKFMRQIVAGSEGTTAVYQAGKESQSIMDYHIGSMKKYLSNINKTISTRSIYHNRVGRKDILYDMLSLKNKFAGAYQTLREAGVKFGDIPDDIKFRSQKEQNDWLDSNFKEDNETLAYYLAMKSIHENDLAYEFGEQAKYGIVAGIVGLKVDNVSSSFMPTARTVNPLNLIKDIRVDNDFGAYDEWVGELTFMPIDRAIKLYNLSDDQAKKLREDSMNSAAINGAYGGFALFSQYRGAGMVSVASTYWRSYTSVKYDEKNFYGNYHYTNTSTQRKNKWVNTIRQAVLIGTSVVVEAGIRENQPININGFRPPLPILTCMPNMTVGRTTSMATKLGGLQTMLDQYVYKLQEAVNTDYGRQLFFDPSEYVGGGNTQTTMIKMRTTRVHEMNRSDGDTKNGLPVEMIDLSISPSATFYMNGISNILERMRLYTNTSALMQGQQQSVVGLGVQSQTIAANTAANYVWQAPMLDHFNKCMNYIVSQARMNLAASGDDQLDIDRNMVLGYGDLRTIKLTKDMSFQQVGVWIDLNSTLDEQRKAEMIMQLQPAIQGGMLDPLAVVKIAGASTLTEAENILENAQREMRDAEKAKMEHEQELADKAAQSSNQQSENQIKMTEIAANAKLQGDQMKIDGKLTEKGMEIANQHAMADNSETE